MLCHMPKGQGRKFRTDCLAPTAAHKLWWDTKQGFLNTTKELKDNSIIIGVQCFTFKEINLSSHQAKLTSFCEELATLVGKVTNEALIDLCKVLKMCCVQYQLSAN